MGDLDGRGALSEKMLTQFCMFFLMSVMTKFVLWLIYYSHKRFSGESDYMSKTKSPLVDYRKVLPTNARGIPSRRSPRGRAPEITVMVKEGRERHCLH